MTDDEKVAQRYRELGTEEPPRALDEAILAAARSARGGRQRWYAPLATAAVLVLAVAVTLNMQLERPGIESPAPQAAPPRVEQPASQQELKLKAETKPGFVAQQPAKEMSRSRRKEAGQAAPPAPSAPVVREPQPFAADRAASPAGAASARSDDARVVESSVTGPLARQMEERTARDAEAVARAPRMGAIQSQAKRAEDAARAKSAGAEPAAELARSAPSPAPAAKPMPLRERPAELTPERELERIADLRRQERHEEADKALAEFRKRHPDYKISGAMLERVERR